MLAPHYSYLTTNMKEKEKTLRRCRGV